MKKYFALAAVILLAALMLLRVPDTGKLKDGDIIFHTSTSAQSKAIQLATQSKYSHVGIIYKQDGKDYVFEAVQPVKLTPLQEWIDRGEGGHFVVKRLNNAGQVLTVEALEKMKRAGQQYLGTDYDLYFQWSDDRIYCSELVWKVYKTALDVELANLRTFSDFDLSHPLVQSKLKERFGNHIPLNEPVIGPDQLFRSELLETVMEK